MKKTLKKIKAFFKKRKKIFKPILFFVGSIFSLIIVAFIVGIITTGGFKNFEERARFEIIVFQERNDDCPNPGWKWYKGNKFGELVYKQNTQFIDYFKEKPDKFIKDIISLKNDDLLEFDYCSAFRHGLKAAHKGNQVAKDFLASLPFVQQIVLPINFPQYKQLPKTQSHSCQHHRENHCLGSNVQKKKLSLSENVILLT